MTTTVTGTVVPCLRIDARAWFAREDFRAYLRGGYWVARVLGLDLAAVEDYDAFTHIEDPDEWLEEVSSTAPQPSFMPTLPRDIALEVVRLLRESAMDGGVVWFCGVD